MSEDRDPTLQSDPLKYAQACYTEASARQEQLRDINITNRLFYEGIDEKLQARAADKTVARSTVFLNLLKPAIDTRIADPISKIDQYPMAVTLTPRDPQAPPELKKKVALMEIALNQQLRDSGYLSDGFREHVQGSEIYRSPSTVKIGWCKKYRQEAYTAPMVTKILSLLGITRTTVKWKTVEYGTPTIEWLQPEEFLYQPNRSRFDQTDYAIHRFWLTKEQFEAMADEFKWDTSKVEKVLEELESDSGDEKAAGSQRDEVESKKETPFDEPFWEGKICVYELFTCDYSTGKERFRKLTVAANKYLLKNEPSYKGVRSPFVLLQANRLPGTLEGLSSVDIGRSYQEFYTELSNLMVDGIAYRLFNIMLKKSGVVFEKPPKIGYGEIWSVNQITEEAIRILNTNMGPAPDLLAAMQMTAQQLHDALSAPDLSRGFEDVPGEKATTAKLRSLGSARRAVPVNKQYGLGIIEVANQVIALNQEYSDTPEMWIIEGGVNVDCPALTAITDPEQDKQDWLLILSTAAQNPLYASPNGMRKLRNIAEKWMSAFVKVNTGDFVPTEAELNQQISDQTAMSNEMSRKQSIVEQMAIQGGMHQTMTAQGDQNVAKAS